MRSSSSVGSPVARAAVAAAAAVVAAVLLQLAAGAVHAPEGTVEVLWLLGWGAAAAAVLLTITTALALSDWQQLPRRRVGVSLALVAVTLLLLAVTAWLHPMLGWGSGTG